MQVRIFPDDEIFTEITETACFIGYLVNDLKTTTHTCVPGSLRRAGCTDF